MFGADDAFMQECKTLVNDYEKIFSRTLEDSEISKINASAGKPVKLSTDASELLNIALDFAQKSDGAFDITIAPVSALWDFSGESNIPPKKADIDIGLEKVGYENIKIDSDYIIMPVGTKLDLGGIAKGYIADKLKEYIVEAGYDSALINLGGNVLCVGKKPDKTDWAIGLQETV